MGMDITTTHYLVLSFASAFRSGVTGILTRRNLIVVLMSVELVLNSVNLNLIAFSYQLSAAPARARSSPIFTICVAAGEAAVGLGILHRALSGAQQADRPCSTRSTC